jgi:hypothetical protein
MSVGDAAAAGRVHVRDTNRKSSRRWCPRPPARATNLEWQRAYAGEIGVLKRAVPVKVVDPATMAAAALVMLVTILLAAACMASLPGADIARGKLALARRRWVFGGAACAYALSRPH